MPELTFLEYNTALFRKVAPYYDWLDLVIAKVRRDFVRFVGPQSGTRILDAATGTGKQAFAFADLGSLITGIDLSPDMLSIAHSKNCFRNVAFAIGDAAELPFKDDSFDLSVMSFALHCMPLNVRIKTVRELKRVTHPSGKVAFVDYGLPTKRLRRQIIYRTISLYETAHWQEFVCSDFESLLGGEGLRIENQRHFLFDSMRMILCAR
jgi:demethylmenaquinone methyltransferase / 2-methoxy-6-polyprenyl-1,4-benzoquinol methylase